MKKGRSNYTEGRGAEGVYTLLKEKKKINKPSYVSSARPRALKWRQNLLFTGAYGPPLRRKGRGKKKGIGVTVNKEWEPLSIPKCTKEFEKSGALGR